MGVNLKVGCEVKWECVRTPYPSDPGLDGEVSDDTEVTDATDATDSGL